ncbi:MAG: methylenetetrahydrofolate reductase [Desulfobacterales bacterium]|jgi:methylenetetrahydrofolate reductase (NADPH)
MFDLDYLVETLTPKRTDETDSMETIRLFGEKYNRVFDFGLGISVPDNPMGHPRFGLLETVEYARLSVFPEKIVMNLNTFHTKKELDRLLKAAVEKGIRYLLVIRGDGGPQLSKLDPKSIGGDKNVATSSDLIRYINFEYADKFITGAAFNQYNRMPFESDRLKQKIEAGAKFVITQPVIGKDPRVNSIFDFGLPVVIEAWMSKNVDLLYKSVRKQKDAGDAGYDPVTNLQLLHEAYPENCVYLSMLSFKQDWKSILPKL